MPQWAAASGLLVVAMVGIFPGRLQVILQSVTSIDGNQVTPSSESS
jgi:hypothetical protein